MQTTTNALTATTKSRPPLPSWLQVAIGIAVFAVAWYPLHWLTDYWVQHPSAATTAAVATTTALEWFGKLVECLLFFMLVLGVELALDDKKREWVHTLGNLTTVFGCVWLLREPFHWITLLALLCLLKPAVKLGEWISKRRCWQMPKVRLGSVTIWIDDRGRPGCRKRWFAKRKDPIQELRSTVTLAQQWIAATEQKGRPPGPEEHTRRWLETDAQERPTEGLLHQTVFWFFKFFRKSRYQP